MQTVSHRLLDMPHLAVMRVSGNDAGRFLQGQLSCRVDDLLPGQSRLAGWHDARGRVRAVFRVVPAGDGYWLTAPRVLAERLCATLRMFVLRADASVDLMEVACAGVTTTSHDNATAEAPAGFPDIVNAVVDDGRSLSVCVATGCWHVIAYTGAATLTAPSGTLPVDAAEIRAGLPQVDERTTLHYVPHMLNLDRLGALDFSKGCYPGQEIIARTEHLGSVKRRARAFVAANAPAPDSETGIVDAGGTKIGSVLRAARDEDGKAYLLAVVALDALDDEVFLDTAAGPRLDRLTLPFE